MNKFFTAIAILALGVGLSARDEVLYFSIDNLLTSPKAIRVLNPNIKFSFGSGSKGQILQKGLMANKKTNAFNKSDQEACEWAFLSALKTFQERAVREGGTKVINITGYYKKQPFDSKTQFQCGAGALMAGVTLRGDIAK
ncbi:excinuclease ABC subunit A [Campylobacter sp. RM16187]|uniref:excinuclease ABC subunit A n=1 Tax=Campylobacter sp. RM16187 TaxID=1660063 RepID=UPI0021B633CF|nr:excinuclease ABC subunit A [Campylobacter sp. RM16187]QKG29153.1 putative excinuclease, ATPase subunit [Campylobacter sp. RM16187]